MMADVSRAIQEQGLESIDEINAFLEQMMASGGPPSFEPAMPLEKAQELMYEAFEARGRRRAQLARQALEICPDCADAYVLLAEETARTPREALALYRKGMEAGGRVLGAEFFEENAGHFWGIVETRPYMRARAGLALALWETGERDAAIEHAQEMLRLNPGDNQGVRYPLMLWLLETEQNKDLTALFEKYHDDATADGLYPQVLFAFRLYGDGSATRTLLKEAMEWNPHVPDYLLGRRRPPRFPSPYVKIGGEDEAAAHGMMALPLWRKTPGALEWLAEMVAAGVALAGEAE
jgi:tetratricopeptide (TPR) repeat protein